MNVRENVLHINYSDTLGGAARSGYKIHAGLRSLGWTSRMLVGHKRSNDSDVQSVSTGALRLLDRVALKAQDWLSIQYRCVPSSKKVLRHPWFQEASILQLYILHSGYFSHYVLPEISRGKILVWRMSDLWSFTGHCAFPGECSGWQSNCQPCPHLDLYPRIRRDTAAWHFAEKKRIYEKCNIHLVATCQWMVEQCRLSPLHRQFPITVIPNGVDVRVFRPDPSAVSELKCDENKFRVLFLSHSVDEVRKGGHVLAQALRALPEILRAKIQLMVVGDGTGDWAQNLGVALWRHPFIQSDEKLRQIYSAAQLYIHAACADNLPNTILEAMACGTPVVATASAGIPEAIEEGVTGQLFPSGDAAALSKIVAALVESPALIRIYADESLKSIARRFTLERQAQSFDALYQNLLSAKKYP